MLKHHPKLKRLFADAEKANLDMEAEETKAFVEELNRVLTTVVREQRLNAMP